MNFLVSDWRERRNILTNHISFVPMQYNIANYSTDPRLEKKSDLDTFDEDILSRISGIPDPLKKNLADTFITGENNKGTEKMPPQVPDLDFNRLPEDRNPSEMNRSDFYQSISGITSFFSNFFGAISGAMFQRRTKSPMSQYYDCYDSDSELNQQMAPESWPSAKIGDQNKRAPDLFSTANDTMNNCRAAAAHCEDKINTVKTLLTTKIVSQTPKFHARRPKRAFVEPKSVEESLEEEFVSDQYTSLANDEYIEYFARPNNQNQVFNEIDAAKMKTELQSLPETTEIVKVLPEVTVKEPPQKEDETETKREIITSCEDKMAKLKLLLREKCQKPKLNDSTDSLMESVKEQRLKKPSKTIPIEKPHDKKFKNPCRLVEKRNKSKMRKSIQDDMIFANEIDLEGVASPENSPVTNPSLQRAAETVEVGSVESIDYFDEFKGRFHSASTTESEDSFQIVFSDSPRPSRVHRPASECESEDSFIIFDDSPDSCYTSNDVFNESEEESEPESEVSDSGCALEVCKLSHTLSRTISDLTDDSLYEDSIPKPIDTKTSQIDTINSKTIGDEINSDNSDGEEDNDEVDCAVRTFQEIPVTDISADVIPGLLIDEARKKLLKSQPPKKVTFSEKPPQVRVMRVWAFAARQARAGHWERHALDRERFKRRIADVDMAVSWVLKPQHRSRVMFQRFMPWWNQQKRKEAAEKKKKVEEEKLRIEEEKLRMEEEQKRIEEVVKKDIDVDNIETAEKVDGKEKEVVIEVGNLKEEKVVKGERKNSQKNLNDKIEGKNVVKSKIGNVDDKKLKNGKIDCMLKEDIVT